MTESEGIMMEYAVRIKNLSKQYPDFSLNNISLDIPMGSIMGLIGENGSGKTTTIKAMLDIVKRDAGDVEILGMDIREREQEVKEEIGVVFGESQFHDFLSAVQISGIMKRVYKNWDEELFSSYLSRFALPEKKKVKEYSRGMAMKLAIAAALSHHPKLLILDEATSGLDPVARDEILDLFFGFIEDGEHSVLIASHITSDLDKVADYVTMIHNGSILFSEEKDQLLEDMGILRCGEEELAGLTDVHVVGVRKNPYGVEAL
ncbi:ABC transporter, ATP-binding protein, partial [Hungatella hathewayi DSM 13479]